MIVHRYKDGSEGYEYEVGDAVRITGVIGHSSWLKSVIGQTGVVTKVGYYNRNKPSRHTAIMDVRYSPDWGPSQCYPWMIEATAGTRVSRTFEAA